MAMGMAMAMAMDLARAHRVARAGGGDPGVKVDPRICQNR